MNQPDIRWKQRFENLTLAYQRLQEAAVANEQSSGDHLIQMALIKAFEMSFELSWKTMKDFLNYNGVDVSLPREVIKQAFAHKIIENGQLWIDMLQDRNLMAHTYDEVRAATAITHITKHYLKAIETLLLFFQTRLV